MYFPESGHTGPVDSQKAAKLVPFPRGERGCKRACDTTPRPVFDVYSRPHHASDQHYTVEEGNALSCCTFVRPVLHAEELCCALLRDDAEARAPLPALNLVDNQRLELCRVDEAVAARGGARVQEVEEMSNHQVRECRRAVSSGNRIEEDKSHPSSSASCIM